MGCQKPYEIHQEQMPVLAVGVRWSGAPLPGEELGGEGSKGMLLDSRLGMSQQRGLEAKRPRATRAGLAWSGVQRKNYLPFLIGH